MKTIIHIQQRKPYIFVMALMMAGTGHLFSQNVGVGSSSFTPNYQFHIYHNSASGTLFQITNTTSGNLPTDGFIINPNAGFNLEFNNQENANMSFFTNNIFRMVIKNDGRVGININPSSNTHRLQVDGISTNPAILGLYSTTVYGVVGATNSGLYGTTNNTTGAGVFGDGGTAATGVYGVTNNASYMAVQGLNTNATGVGIWGTGANSTVGSYFAGSGVWGRGTVGVGGFFSSTIYGALGTVNGGAYGQYSSNIFGYLGYSHSGALGVSNSTSGAGVFGSGGTTTDGVYGQTNCATYSGVTGINSNNSGTGVYGANIAASGNYQGDGVFGVSPQLRGGGTTGWNINATGVGVFGAGNNAAFAKFPVGGCGGAFTGTKVGGFGYTYDTTSVGTYNIPYVGIYGIARVYRTTAADLYHMGVYGRLERTGTADARRSAGVFGFYNQTSTWGALGYLSSASTSYGVYGSTAYGTGTGKIIEQPGDVATCIGIGGWGDLFGAEIHGKVYGIYVEGGHYGIYSNGKIFTNDIIVQLQNTGKSELTPLYTNLSTDVSIQTSGYGTLVNGSAEIKFDENFNELISQKIPVVVTVSPLGNSAGIYISEITASGFVVKENNNGKSNVEFTFIAIGRKDGCENPVLSPDVLDASYTEKIAQGLPNEGILTAESPGLYYSESEAKLIVGNAQNFKTCTAPASSIAIDTKYPDVGFTKMNLVKQLPLNFSADKINSSGKIKMEGIIMEK